VKYFKDGNKHITNLPHIDQPTSTNIESYEQEVDAFITDDQSVMVT
jgi:hypothetical protein